MNATIDITYNQVLQLVKQLPVRSQLRLGKYLQNLVTKKKDPALFTKEEFYHRIDEAKKGPSYELKEGETLEDLIERVR